MKGLHTARVVVVDDMPDEAMPVIQALGCLGVGCVHIKGDEIEALPASPLTGIRLVFLDMKLGTAHDARTTGAHTANVFARVVAPGTAPILVVMWTRHPEIIEEFKAALFQETPSFRTGTFFTSMDKPGLLTDEDAVEPAARIGEAQAVAEEPSTGLSRAGIEKLKQSVEEKLRAFQPLQVAWACEQLAHDAATSTTTAVSAIVSERAKIVGGDDDAARNAKWLAALGHVYRSLILASAGKNRTDETAFTDLLGAVVEIYRDRLDMHAAIEAIDMAQVLGTAWAGPDDQERADLNTMFLTARVDKIDAVLKPGNVYVAKPEAGMDCPHRACYVDPKKVIRECIKVRGYKANRFGQLEDNIAGYQKRNPIPTENVARDATELDGLWAEITASCIPMLLELTPSCDVAQRTQHLARFAGGVLVTGELAKKISDSESVKEIGPIKIPGKDGIWHPIVSARFPFSMPCENIKTVPLIRIRQGALLDVQVWFAAQAARPGYLKAEKQ